MVDAEAAGDVVEAVEVAVEVDVVAGEEVD